MLNSNFYIRVGDTLPVIKSALSDYAGPIDITGCTIELHIEGVGTFIGAIVGDPTEGNVEYEWQTDDLPTAGVFPAYWRIVYPPGVLKSSFPNYTEFSVVVASE